MSEIEKLLKIAEEWELQFKADLLENILNDYSNIDEFIDIVMDEWINIWKTEAPELIEIYENFERKLSTLNMEKLEREYQKIYTCSKISEEHKFYDLKTAYNWIKDNM
ncbi:hypothetical protein [Clostridium butyricum]|uniref:hypothetical protein n=1 Tax=Clostridium butyricum TaxID=1492 RepID=UPI00374E3526